MRSLVSITRRQVMLSGSMSRRAKRLRSSGVSSLGSVFVMPSFLRRRNITWAKAGAILAWGARRSNIACRRLWFVEHARVDGGGEQLLAALMAWMSPVRWRLNSSIGMIWL